MTATPALTALAFVIAVRYALVDVGHGIALVST